LVIVDPRKRTQTRTGAGAKIQGKLSYHYRPDAPGASDENIMQPAAIDARTATGGYTILVGDGLATRLGHLLDERGVGRRRIVVSNPVVWRLHGAEIAQALPGAEVIQVPDGERHKTLQTVARIYEALVAAGADRASVVVAVGGGVIGDMAGFAAATYLRGVGLVHVPTTLLAQVDASVGGKVGVNLPAGKNLVGSFHPPLLVVTDPVLLETLPRREFRAGLYEVIKYGMVCSAPLFETLQRAAPTMADRRADVVGPLVADCCAIKAAVVSADEREAGPRRVLNFGHTAGHAIETLTAYRRFRHGEAVAWGMLVASELAVSRGLLPRDDRDALEELVMALGPLPQVADLPVPAMIKAMRRDKKVTDGTLHFVLPAGIGASSIVGDVTELELEAALAAVGFSSRRG
jgi:3-dehydroquinate synthase